MLVDREASSVESFETGFEDSRRAQSVTCSTSPAHRNSFPKPKSLAIARDRKCNEGIIGASPIARESHGYRDQWYGLPAGMDCH